MDLGFIPKQSAPVQKDKNFFVSVVLPAYNEEKTLAGEIQTIREVMGATSHPFEIIVIDDGSTDQTASIAEAERGVRLLRHGINRGVGAARKTGILASQGEIIVTSDADGTYPHEDIPRLLEQFPDSDMTIGARTLVVQEPFYRLWPKNLIRIMASRLSGVDIKDLNTGLRAFKKSMAMRYLALLPEGHSWESTITLAFLCNGHAVKFIPINYFKRKGGKSSFHPIRDTYSMTLLAIRTVMYFNPLRVLMPLSALFLGGSFMKMCYDWIIYRDIGGVDVSLFLTRILIGICGFLADLLVMVHKGHLPKV